MKNYMLSLIAVLAPLFFPTAIADAQTLNDRLQESTDVIVCRSGGTASRLKDNCSFERTEKIGLELERTITIDLSVDETPFCGAAIALEYYQRNAFAHVEGTIDNEECGASSGGYVIAARIRNSAGEIETLEFEEAWQRSDNEPIEVTADYPIGDGVELLRLGSRRVTCRCADGE